MINKAKEKIHQVHLKYSDIFKTETIMYLLDGEKKTTPPKVFTKHFVISQQNSPSSSIPQVKRKSARTVFTNLQVKLLRVKHLIRLVDAVA